MSIRYIGDASASCQDRLTRFTRGNILNRCRVLSEGYDGFVLFFEKSPHGMEQGLHQFRLRFKERLVDHKKSAVRTRGQITNDCLQRRVGTFQPGLTQIDQVDHLASAGIGEGLDQL